VDEKRGESRSVAATRAERREVLFEQLKWKHNFQEPNEAVNRVRKSAAQAVAADILVNRR
jgi:hypothetical protein